MFLLREQFAGGPMVRAGQLRMVLTIGVAVADTAYVGGANQQFWKGMPRYWTEGPRAKQVLQKFAA